MVTIIRSETLIETFDKNLMKKSLFTRAPNGKVSNGIRSNNITLQNKILQQNGKHNIDRQGSLIQN